MNRSTKVIITILSLVIIGLGIWLAYELWKKPSRQASTSFETCLSAGNPTMESNPRQCRDEISGVTFTEKISEQPAGQTQLSTRQYTSPKGVTIELNNWADNREISSPLTLTGRVPGSWSFEASFAVELTNNDGTVIATVPANLDGEWMTDELVPFTVVIPYDSSRASDDGSLILRKSNPSDLPESNDAVEVKIRF